LIENRYIYMPKHKKEPNFFNTDMSNFQIQSDKEYIALFNDVTEKTHAIGEATVWYLFSDTAVDNILRLRPDAKFIVGLRDPVTLVISYHLQLCKSLGEDKEDFWEAWSAQDDRERGLDLPRYCQDPRKLQYKKACSIGTQLDRLLSKVPREQVMWYYMEEVKKDPQAVYKRIVKFLGVPDSPIPDLVHANKAAVNRSKSLRKILWWIGRLKSKLPFLPSGLGIMAYVMELNKKPLSQANKLDLSKAQKQELETTFASEKVKLTAITGYKFH